MARYELWLMIVFAVVATNLKRTESQDVLNTPCDINARNESCPNKYCCVRDEYLFTETYCRRYGTAGSNCGTRESSFECPCEAGYQCASNIHGHITSLFGKCFPVQGGSTDATNMDTTTAAMTTAHHMTTETTDAPTTHSDGQSLIG